MSLSSAVVTEAEHAAWVGKSLASTERWLFVAEHGGQVMGQARLDVIHQLGALGSAEVSITVAPGARGQGHAAAILVAAEHEARGIGITRLEARIKPDNESSIRAFKRAGYYGFARAGEVLRCERRIAAYP
jgi:RimJ/RimL family protein N-acetyltransferase